MAFQSGEWADVPSVQMGRAEPALSTKLNVVISFIESEIPLVTNLLEKSLELSGQIPRTLLLLPFKGLPFTKVKEIALKAFATVEMLRDCEGKTSDWQEGHPMRSATGPNSMFRQAAWYAYLKGRSFGPWLWMEPDCTPIQGMWWRDLEHEWNEYQKPFMGVKMTFPNGRTYMNGVGIYPWNAIQYAPLLVQSAMWTQHPDIEIGFDVAGGQDVLKNAHMTKRIQLMNHLVKEKIEVLPETVLIHGRNNLSGKQLGAHLPSKEPEEPGSSPAQPNVLGGDGERREAVTEVLEASPSPAISSHETLVQETCSGAGEAKTGGNSAEPVPLQTDSEGYGAISKDIRSYVGELVRLWDNQPHRKVLIVKELRKAKLVPKHFR